MILYIWFFIKNINIFFSSMNLRKFYLYIFVDDIKVIIKKRINLNYARSINLKFYKQINFREIIFIQKNNL